MADQRSDGRGIYKAKALLCVSIQEGEKINLEIPKVSCLDKINKVNIGDAKKAITVDGETGYPFFLFEGKAPNLPRIAFEVYETRPEDWTAGERTLFKDVLGDPIAWAKKTVSECNAEMVCLRLVSTDPNGLNRSAEEVAEIVKEVASTVPVPLIVWGCESADKDAGVLPKIAEVCQDRRLILGPATDKNYKKIGAAAIAYKHTIVASTPIDINLAKQLNILLGDLGVPDDQILIDPNIGGCSLGYGIEYTFTVMERARQAALTQVDKKLQFPIIANFATDVWKKKEAKTTEEEDPKLGDVGKRGVLLEALTGIVLLLAGADILVMRHPSAIELVRQAINNLIQNE